MAYPPPEYRNEEETCEHFLHITFEGETPKKLPVLRCAAFTGICLFMRKVPACKGLQAGTRGKLIQRKRNAYLVTRTESGSVSSAHVRSAPAIFTVKLRAPGVPTLKV